MIRGVVKRLLEGHDQGGRKAWVSLHVQRGNEEAVRLYRREGLVERGVVRGYYRGGGGDAVEMGGWVEG